MFCILTGAQRLVGVLSCEGVVGCAMFFYSTTILAPSQGNRICFVAASHAMGSVPDNYKCPWCGRVGNGGYAVDGGPFYPICTGGDHSCAWYRLIERGQKAIAVRRDQLNAIFPQEGWWLAAAPFVAEFLVPLPEDIPRDQSRWGE